MWKLRLVVLGLVAALASMTAGVSEAAVRARPLQRLAEIQSQLAVKDLVQQLQLTPKSLAAA